MVFLGGPLHALRGQGDEVSVHFDPLVQSGQEFLQHGLHLVVRIVSQHHLKRHVPVEELSALVLRSLLVLIDGFGAVSRDHLRTGQDRSHMAFQGPGEGLHGRVWLCFESGLLELSYKVCLRLCVQHTLFPLPADEVLHRLLQLGLVLGRKAEEGAGGDRHLDLLPCDPAAVDFEAEVFLVLGLDDPVPDSVLVGGGVLDVGAHREAGGVGSDLDAVAQLSGVHQRPAAFGKGPLGCGPASAVRPLARPETLQGGRAHALAQGRVKALPVHLREAPDLVQGRPGVALQPDIYHESHPLHRIPAEEPAVGVHGEAGGRRCLGIAGFSSEADFALRDQREELDGGVVAGEIVALPSRFVQSGAGHKVIEGDVLGKLVDDLWNRGEGDGVPLGKVAVDLPVRVRNGLVDERADPSLPLLRVFNEVCICEDLTHSILFQHGPDLAACAVAHTGQSPAVPSLP
nr:MAG TPA: hypothetical protein [Caudoviricetes sp.]